MKIMNGKTGACVLVSTLLYLSAVGQSNTPARYEMMRGQHMWSHTINSAGDILDQRPNFSTVVVGYDSRHGQYRRPQTGFRVGNTSVYSEGAVRLDKALVWGEFEFRHQSVSDALYNASITDPYRGQPYYVVDKNSSDWRNQFYHMKFRASTPIVRENWAFGIEGTYKASLAAKQRDIRVDTRFYMLQLIPSVVYTFGNKSSLGLSIIYSSMKEDSEQDNVNTYIDQNYYELHGLGVATTGLGSGRSTNYFGNKWGVGLQYGLHAGAWSLVSELQYSKHVENVEISFSSPKKDGLVKHEDLQCSFELQNHGTTFTNQIGLKYNRSHIKGIRYLSQRDNSESQTGWITLHHYVRSTYLTNMCALNYALIRHRGAEYDWRIDMDAGYVSHDDRFLLPQSTKDSKNIFLSLGVKKNIILSPTKDKRLIIGANGSLKNGLSGAYVYNGPNPEYITSSEMEPADERYMVSDAWGGGVSMTYSQQIKSNAPHNMFAKVGYDILQCTQKELGNRSTLQVSLGFNF